jgi:hypothetical protein
MFKAYSFPKVTELHVDFSMQTVTDEEWSKFTPAFPSVTYLTAVSNFGRLGTDLERLLTSWTSLECIEVRIEEELRDVIKLPNYPFLDEILTGIPEGKCQKFRKAVPSSREDYRKFQVRPSLADLKQLKVLALVFTSMGSVEKHLKQRPILSKVSYHFCQAVHPNLKLLTLCKQGQQ